MKKVCTLENMQTINPSATLKETLIVDKNIPSENHLEIRLASFSKQLDSQKNSFVPGQKIKIVHAKGTMVMPGNSIPSIRVSSPISNINECRFQVMPITDMRSSLPTKSSKLVVDNSLVDNKKNVEEECDIQLISPSCRWLSQPRSYRGAKRDNSQRKVVRKISIPSFVDTTDGETSGMGSSVDEPIESSTESASEASSSFLQPKLSLRPLSMSPLAFKKRRGGWPKGRKRKPEIPGTKPPKAPLTAYVLFLNERRKYYKETHSQLPFVEVTKLLGAEWSAMTPEQKSVYITRSDMDKRRYRSELQTFRQSHDYQILLRKKRMKNAINRGQTTEESSDFTDEVDDDESEELYCRTCDQWFSSLHNKREHLYGKLHLQAITGEYQRERVAEAKRQSSATCASATSSSASPIDKNCDEAYPDEADQKKEGPALECAKEIEHGETCEPLLLKSDTHSSRRNSIGVTSTTEDDPDEDEEEDDEEDREYDGEEEVTEEEGGSTEYWNSASDSERVTDAAEGVINKVLNREKEIRFLRGRYEKSRRHNRKVFASLLNLQARHKFLKEEQERLLLEEKSLLQEAKNLVKLSEFSEFNIEEVIGSRTGTNRLLDEASKLPDGTDGVNGTTSVSLDDDKILSFIGSRTKSSGLNSVQESSDGSTEEYWFSGNSSSSGTNIASYVTSNVVTDKLSPSQIILTDANFYSSTSKSTPVVPIGNIKMKVPNVQLNGSKVIDKCTLNAGEKNCTIGNEFCSSPLEERIESRDICLPHGPSNPVLVSPARKKHNPPFQVDVPKTEDTLNVRKYIGQFDHSYSKSWYSGIPSPRKMPISSVKMAAEGVSNTSLLRVSLPNSHVPSQASNDVGTMPKIFRLTQKKNEVNEGKNISSGSTAQVIRELSTCTISRGKVSRNIPGYPLPGTEICLTNESTQDEIHESSDEPLQKLFQDNNTFVPGSCNGSINFAISGKSKDGEKDDHSADGENTFVFPEENILSVSESPELKYYDVSLLQDDMESLGGSEFHSIQWEDVPPFIDSLPILDNIFEEDYLTNFSYENST